MCKMGVCKMGEESSKSRILVDREKEKERGGGNSVNK